MRIEGEVNWFRIISNGELWYQRIWFYRSPNFTTKELFSSYWDPRIYVNETESSVDRTSLNIDIVNLVFPWQKGFDKLPKKFCRKGSSTVFFCVLDIHPLFFSKFLATAETINVEHVMPPAVNIATASLGIWRNYVPYLWTL